MQTQHGIRTGIAFAPIAAGNDDDSSALGLAFQWVTEYLSAPHPDLGRSGDVCPFTGLSVQAKKFWVAELGVEAMTMTEAQSTLEDAIDVYEAVRATDVMKAKFATVVVLLPHMKDFSVVEGVQRLLKNEFVARGLMIGQFYPGCQEPGLWNPDFHPLDAPIPMLAVRGMVPSDFPFLISDTDWLKSYLKKFAPEVPAKLRAHMATVVSEAQQVSEAQHEGVSHA